MAINFPDSPTMGDSFTAAGRTWVWDGTTWNNDSTADYASVQFVTDAGVTAGIGELAWNAAEETLDIGLNNEVTLQVGQETLMRVKNMTGDTIANGVLVMFDGVNGDQINVAPAITDGSVPAEYVIGITTEEILDGESGFVTTFGLVRGLATSGYGIAGTILYADPTTAGNLTATQPSAPAYRAPVAAVTKSGPGDSGILFVRMQDGHGIGALNDVQITSAATGEVLQYDGTKWVNSGVTVAEVTGLQAELDAKAPLLATLVTDATTARTLTASDANKTILFTSGSDVTLTIDAATDFPVGARVDIVRDGAGVLTVTASGATVAAAEVSTTTGSFTIGTQYSAATLLCVGTDSYRLIGNITIV